MDSMVFRYVKTFSFLLPKSWMVIVSIMLQQEIQIVVEDVCCTPNGQCTGLYDFWTAC